jgi:hypothetical protein
MKILLGDFNAKVGKEDIFKPTIGNESLHKSSTDNGVRLVNFATSKILRVESMMFTHRNIYKYTYEYIHIKKEVSLAHPVLGCLQMGKPTIRLTIFW